MRLGRVLMAALAAATVSACGGDVAAPSAISAPLGDGAFIVDLLGDSKRCDDIKSPQAGTGVTVLVSASHDGNGNWIARAADASGGNFEFRLARGSGTATAPSGPPGPLDTAVIGSWSGSAVNSFQIGPFAGVIPPTTASFGAGASVQGIMRSAARFADGFITSEMTFSRAGVSSTCPAGAVGWTINPR